MQEFIRCPKCGRCSFNKNDIEKKFCPVCGFHEDFAVTGGTVDWNRDLSLKLDPDDYIEIEMSPGLRDSLKKGGPWKEMRFSRWDGDKAVYVPKEEGQ
jgi:hypothetical protein